MRGKHATAAERRRHIEDLEKRATNAERDARKAAAELAELKEKTDAQITLLRAEVADLKRQRDMASSPALKVALQDAQKLRRRIDELKSQWAGGTLAFSILKRHASTALRNAGLSEFEIQMVWKRAQNDIRDDEVGRSVDIAVGAESALRAPESPQEDT